MAALGDVGVARASEDDGLVEARRRAAWRRRRVIVNNDGDDAWMAQEPTADGYLATRIKPMFDGTHVDAMFLSTTEDLGYNLHRSAFAQLFDRDHPGIARSAEVRLVAALASQGTDVLEVAVDYVHSIGKEIFWSHRMNGMEDMVADFLLGDYKRDHPQWWLATPEFGKRFGTGDPRHWYMVMDYGVAEVRAYVLRIIEEVIANYDVDGVEMDYMRDPWLFKETFSDPMRPVSDEHCAVMVDFHQRVRAMLDAKSRRIGRPLLLALRVPKWPDLSRYLGLDLEAHLRSGAVDVLIGSGGYSPFAIPEAFLDLARRYRVPASLCISNSGMLNRQKLPGTGRADLPAWRGAAASLWDAGVHGQYLFNTFPSGPRPNAAVRIMREIGEPAAMAGKPMVFLLDNWDDFAGAGYCNHAMKRADLLPIALGAGPGRRSCTFHVGLAPDVLAASAIRLRTWFEGRADDDHVAMVLNGHALEPEPDDGADPALRAQPRAGELPLRIEGLPVGTARTLHVDLPGDIEAFRYATLWLTADDFDAQQEVALAVNGHTGAPWPRSILGDVTRQGAMLLDIAHLRPGANELRFTFRDDLDGTTVGFAVLELELRLFTDPPGKNLGARGAWFDYAVPSAYVRRGRNELSGALRRAAQDTQRIQLVHFELSVAPRG